MTEISNIEAEQNVLGCFLLNNKAYFEVMGKIKVDDFHDPVHQRIFSAIEKRCNNDELVSPVILRQVLEHDEGLKELGGPEYLVRLSGAAIGINAIGHYVKLLRQCSRKRSLHLLLTESAKQLETEDVTVDEVVGKIESSLIDSEPESGGSVSMMAAVAKAAELANDAHHAEGIIGVTSGLADLDAMTGGLQGGELVLLGGRPSMGKTAVAMSMALDAARSGKGVVISSLEMTPDSLALRAITNEANQHGNLVAYTDAKKGTMSDEGARHFFEASPAVGKLPIQILPSNMRDMGAIYGGVKKAQRILEGKGTPLALIVIDYIGLIGGGPSSRYEKITEISIALKALSMKMNLPVLALVQLSRAVESRDLNNRRPMLSDLRESGQLEQDADMVMFCYRHEYYLDRETPDEMDVEGCMAHGQALDASRSKMEIIVAKQRMGEIGTVHVGFNPATNFLWDQNNR